MLFRRALPSTAVIVSSASQTRNSLVVHRPKADINLGKFNINDAYNESFGASGRMPDNSMEEYRKTYFRLDEFARRAENQIRSQGAFHLPMLDYPPHAGVMPLLSGHQLRVHYFRHHQAYIDKLNQLVAADPSLQELGLDDIINRTRGDSSKAVLFNQAAQHYNHCFFWKSIAPHGTHCPPDLQAALSEQYGSLEKFQQAFKDAALNLFGSGWVFLVYDHAGRRFDILSYGNAACPLGLPSITPLLCVDVWEHAYYIDYENSRANFMAKFFDVADYHWAERNWKRSTGQEYNEFKFS